MSIAKVIDHTLLKPDATYDQIDVLCAEAREYGFASVCINPCHVARCAKALKDSGVKVCTVIGFPLGAATPETKAFEALQAIRNGAEEVDMVINIGAVKSADWPLVSADILAVVAAAQGGTLVKVIIETCLLTDAEKEQVCRLAKRAGADYVKTSTGFSTGGATAGDVALMRRTVGSEMGVKASGGIRDYTAAKAMLDAGATRIGASAGIKIVQQEHEAGKA